MLSLLGWWQRRWWDCALMMTINEGVKRLPERVKFQCWRTRSMTGNPGLFCVYGGTLWRKQRSLPLRNSLSSGENMQGNISSLEIENPYRLAKAAAGMSRETPWAHRFLSIVSGASHRQESCCSVCQRVTGKCSGKALWCECHTRPRNEVGDEQVPGAVRTGAQASNESVKEGGELCEATVVCSPWNTREEEVAPKTHGPWVTTVRSVVLVWESRIRCVFLNSFGESIYLLRQFSSTSSFSVKSKHHGVKKCLSKCIDACIRCMYDLQTTQK